MTLALLTQYVFSVKLQGCFGLSRRPLSETVPLQPQAGPALPRSLLLLGMTIGSVSPPLPPPRGGSQIAGQGFVEKARLLSHSQPDPSSTIIQVAFNPDSNNDGSLETTGTNPDTLLGYDTFSNGCWTLTFSNSVMGLTAGTHKLFAQAEDSDSVYSDPAALTPTVQ